MYMNYTKSSQISSQYYARCLLMATKNMWLRCNFLRDVKSVYIYTFQPVYKHLCVD